MTLAEVFISWQSNIPTTIQTLAAIIKPASITPENIGSQSVYYATSAGNADTVDSLHIHSARNNEANKIVRTDANGYIQCGYINSSNGDEGNNSNPTRVWGTNGSDSYLRSYLTSALSVNYSNYSGYLSGKDAYTNGTDGWWRSNGSCGWYNASYAGGVYMEDTTWVRVYNSKAFYVANQIAATGNITAYYSDERLKRKTGYITNAIDKIKSITAFYYTNNELAQSFGYTETKQQLGLSAQEIEAILPEVVSLAPFDMQTDEFNGNITSKSGENYMTLDYARLVPLLVEAIKEQQKQIEELKLK